MEETIGKLYLFTGAGFLYQQLVSVFGLPYILEIAQGERTFPCHSRVE